MNHPNRGWRARMRSSLADWLATAQGRVLAELPIRTADRADYEQGMRNRLSDAYTAGYEHGRRSAQSR